MLLFTVAYMQRVYPDVPAERMDDLSLTTCRPKRIPSSPPIYFSLITVGPPVAVDPAQLAATERSWRRVETLVKQIGI